MPNASYLSVVLGLSLLCVLAGLCLYNRLVRARERTREAWSGIEVQLKRRAELIPNLVRAVKGYAAHERAVFVEVARARRRLERSSGTTEAAAANGRLTRSLTHLLAVAEAYPGLRASRNFLELQVELSDVEEKIAYARQFYNRNVAGFNARIRSFPAVLVARAFGFDPFEFFDADAGDTGAPRLDLAQASGGPSPRGAGGPT